MKREGARCIYTWSIEEKKKVLKKGEQPEGTTQRTDRKERGEWRESIGKKNLGMTKTTIQISSIR